MSYRVALVSTVISPFQIELADAMNASGAVDYHILFARGFGDHRGSHWHTKAANHPNVHVPETGHSVIVDWVRERLAQIRPSIVIVGGYRGDGLRGAKDYAQQHEVGLGFWGEPPSPRNEVAARLRNKLISRHLEGLDFALCIGDRAFDAYAGSVPIGQAHVVPYGQDLSGFFAIERSQVPNRLRFLFSGQLIPRHNLSALFCGLAEVADHRPRAFEVIIAASGPDQNLLDRCIASSPELATVLTYDRDYKTWNDRVRPFETSDILLYPSFHSGWGLVVPEAMAAGMLVVATSGVEAVRSLITPGVDGLMIDGSKSSVVQAVNWCLDNPARVRQMGERARSAAMQGSAEHVASLLLEILPQYRRPNLR